MQQLKVTAISVPHVLRTTHCITDNAYKPAPASISVQYVVEVPASFVPLAICLVQIPAVAHVLPWYKIVPNATPWEIISATIALVAVFLSTMLVIHALPNIATALSVVLEDKESAPIVARVMSSKDLIALLTMFKTVWQSL